MVLVVKLVLESLETVFNSQPLIVNKSVTACHISKMGQSFLVLQA